MTTSLGVSPEENASPDLTTGRHARKRKGNKNNQVPDRAHQFRFFFARAAR